MNHKYVSNAEVCKRILLGALSSRFEAISFTSADLGTIFRTQAVQQSGSVTSDDDNGDDIFTRGSGTHPTRSTAASSIDLDFVGTLERSRLDESGRDIDGRVQSSSLGSFGSEQADYRQYSKYASPYLSKFDAFEPCQTSSSLNAQQDAVSTNVSVDGNQAAHKSYQSPGHSPRISPHLVPQQQRLPLFTAKNNFGMNHSLSSLPQSGLEVFPPLSKAQSTSDFGLADQLNPPGINVEFAPPATNKTSIMSQGIYRSPAPSEFQPFGSRPDERC